MLSLANKTAVVKDNQIHPTDTGSVDVQVAIISKRVTELTEHLKVHKKDLSSRLGLMKMVAERRKLLTYLKRTNLERYNALVEKMQLKK